MLIEWKWIFFENALIIYGCALLPLRFRSGRNRHLYPNEVRGVVVVPLIDIAIKSITSSKNGGGRACMQKRKGAQKK